MVHVVHVVHVQWNLVIVYSKCALGKMTVSCSSAFVSIMS